MRAFDRISNVVQYYIKSFFMLNFFGIAHISLIEK